MVAVITRVREASVRVDGELVSQIGTGLLVLLGVAKGDTAGDAEYLAGKVTSLRIFEDETGKMGKSVADVLGGVLVIPNFTLTADCRKGRRPDFTGAAIPREADDLYEKFSGFCEAAGVPVLKGVFGADMAVASTNDGPVTILMDTQKMRGQQERSI